MPTKNADAYEGSGAGRRRREQILRAAHALVVEHGQVTVQMVADAVDITDAAVFYHFNTKEQLFVGLLRYIDERYEAAATAIDEIDRAVLAMGELQATPHLMAFYAELSSRAVDPSHPAHEFFVHRYIDVQRRLVEAATVRLPDRTAREIDELVRTFLAAIDGLQRRWLVQRDFDMRDSSRVAETQLFGPSPALDAALEEGSAPRVLPPA